MNLWKEAFHQIKRYIDIWFQGFAEKGWLIRHNKCLTRCRAKALVGGSLVFTTLAYTYLTEGKQVVASNILDDMANNQYITPKFYKCLCTSYADWRKPLIWCGFAALRYFERLNHKECVQTDAPSEAGTNEACSWEWVMCSCFKARLSRGRGYTWYLSTIGSVFVGVIAEYIDLWDVLSGIVLQPGVEDIHPLRLSALGQYSASKKVFKPNETMKNFCQGSVQSV